MNSDSSNAMPSHNSDKSFLNLLGDMIKEHENNGNSRNCAGPLSKNLTVKNYENGLPKDPRIRHHNVSSTTETIVWGRMFPESDTPQPALKCGDQVKKEAEESDELSKMMKILQGESPSKSGPQVPASSQLPHPVTPNTIVKEEEMMEESDRQQSFTLLEQHEEYLKKAADLQTKINILKLHRQELKGDGNRSPSPETMLLLKQNTKMQLVHQNKLKNINNLIEMLSGIIGERALETQKTRYTEEMTKIKVSPPKRFNYVFYDCELHWCRVCNIFPATATDYLTHLHSKDHKTKVAAAFMEAPWHSALRDDSFPTHPLADTKRMPIKGLQFFVPSTAWYCKLCDQFVGDLHCASAHLKTVTHSRNYSVFVKENPHWESDWMLDRQKAFEEMRLTVTLEEVDSFNIEGISGNEGTENGKPEKYLGSSISSDSDAQSVKKEKVSRNRAKLKDHETDPSVSKKTTQKIPEQVIVDRQLLDDTNSTKVPKPSSPPRSHHVRDIGNGYRRNEVRRHDYRNMQHDHRQTDHRQRHDRYSRHTHRHLRHDGYPLRHDRGFTRLSSEWRSDRDRSEIRSVRDRSEERRERDRSEIRVHDRSEERRERDRRERFEISDSPVSDNSSPDLNAAGRSVVVGKITPFKVKSSNKNETKVLNKEELKKRKEEMDAEIQKKVKEFKTQLIQIQAESQMRKTEAASKPGVPNPAPIVPTSALIHAPSYAPASVHVDPPPIAPSPAVQAIHQGFVAPTPADDLDMNQVVEMATHILQQQAMLAPFGVDPLCMTMPPMGAPPLMAPPGLQMGIRQPVMQMPFMPFMGGRMPFRAPNRNIRKKSYDGQSSGTNNVKQDQSPDTLHPPGED